MSVTRAPTEPSRADRTRARHRCALARAGLLGILLTAGTANATDKERCVEDHAAAQELRRRGRLLDAQQKLASCAETGCPAMVRADCAPWLRETEAALPSVVIDARESNGVPITTVKVWVDRALTRDRLEEGPITLDPGEHTMVFANVDGSTQEKRVFLREGEQMRTISVTFAATPATPPAERAHRSWLLPTILAATGAVAVGSSVYLGGHALAQRNALECQPYCQQADVSSIRNELHAGTVSLGIGLVLGGIATWLLLTQPPQSAGPGPLSWQPWTKPAISSPHVRRKTWSDVAIP